MIDDAVVSISEFKPIERFILKLWEYNFLGALYS